MPDARASDRTGANDDSLPPEGWAGPDDRGHLSYVMHGRLNESAPERDGYEPYFVGVHGLSWTRWWYRPIKEEDA